MTVTHQIFVSDDDEDDLFLFQEIFKALHLPTVKVTCFKSPYQLLEAIDPRQAPDIIITDYRQPQMSGLELIQLVREVPISPKPRILVWSSVLSLEDVTLCLAAGADRCVEKPTGYLDMVCILQAVAGHWLSQARQVFSAP